MLKWKLTLVSIKMFFRQREAIIWTLLFPLFLVILFGFVRFGGLGRLNVGAVNEAGAEGARLVDSLRAVNTLKLTEGGKDVELDELKKGERDLVVVIPAGYAGGAGEAGAAPGTVTMYADVEAHPQQTQLGALVLQRVLDEQVFASAPAVRRIRVATAPVVTRNLNYIDFLLPGILSMSIMQMGIFGVAFGFVSLKKRGIFRRLWVTPIRPGDFIFAQVAMRLLVTMLQMSVMLGVGVLFLDLHFIGSLLLIYLFGALGAIAFLGIGFSLAGISRSEDQVAPLANVITLPMMALSGIFFSRANLPGVVQTITSVFPLTYLADGIRAVAIDGAGVGAVLPQLAGLAVWGLITGFAATRLFRWE
jgi:ABC-2 type transport system permease protein